MQVTMTVLISIRFGEHRLLSCYFLKNPVFNGLLLGQQSCPLSILQRLRHILSVIRAARWVLADHARLVRHSILFNHSLLFRRDATTLSDVGITLFRRTHFLCHRHLLCHGIVASSRLIATQFRQITPLFRPFQTLQQFTQITRLAVPLSAFIVCIRSCKHVRLNPINQGRCRRQIIFGGIEHTGTALLDILLRGKLVFFRGLFTRLGIIAKLKFAVGILQFANLHQARQIIQRLQAEVIKKLFGGGVHRRTTRHIAITNNAHPVAFNQGFHHLRTDHHPTHIFNIATGNRLTVGNQRQGFE